MPTVSELARITTQDGAVWRLCASCKLLAPLPPHVKHCEAARLRREARA